MIFFGDLTTSFNEVILFQFIGFYRPIGCWADYDRHTADYSLETKHGTLQDNYLIRKDAIRKCGEVAFQKKFNVFALHDGGSCSAGNNLQRTFDKDGNANNCAFGKGGTFANDVYEIRSKDLEDFFISVIQFHDKSELYSG